jgi:RHS repeat-associated protein
MPRSRAEDPHSLRQTRTILLASDSSHSVISEVVDGKANAITYSAFGQHAAQQEVSTRLGYTGQLREMQTSWYLLGNGYRAYNPKLMRFHSPDSWSPFGAGGLNAYMYCVDPVNFSDPTGHKKGLVRRIVSATITFFFRDSTGPSVSRSIAAERGLGPRRKLSGDLAGLAGPVSTLASSEILPLAHPNSLSGEIHDAGRKYLGYEKGALAAGLTTSTKPSTNTPPSPQLHPSSKTKELVASPPQQGTGSWRSNGVVHGQDIELAKMNGGLDPTDAYRKTAAPTRPPPSVTQAQAQAMVDALRHVTNRSRFEQGLGPREFAVGIRRL